MIAGRRTVLFIACIWLAADAVLGGDAGADARWRCPYSQDGTCIPNPRSYGYYPTRWRKWPAGKGPETVPTPKPVAAETEEPEKETEELPAGDDQATEKEPGAADMLPDETSSEAIPKETMPSDTDQSPTQPELPSELKSDLPQPPDLENLLPDEGPDEAPAPPKKRPPKEIPTDDDPFKDDPLPSENMGGSLGKPKSVATVSALPPIQAPPASTTGQMNWRPDPRIKQSTHNPMRTSQAVSAAAPMVEKPISTAANITTAAPVKQSPHQLIRASQTASAEAPPVLKPNATPATVAETAPAKQSTHQPIRASQTVSAEAPPVSKLIATPATMAETAPARQFTRNPIRNSQIILADAQTVIKPNATATSAVEAIPVKLTRSRANPLRSPTSGMVLPGPGGDDEVRPAAQWSAEGAASEAADTASGSTGSWRANPLRTDH